MAATKAADATTTEPADMTADMTAAKATAVTAKTATGIRSGCHQRNRKKEHCGNAHAGVQGRAQFTDLRG
jgi:hypothetical protein